MGVNLLGKLFGNGSAPVNYAAFRSVNVNPGVDTAFKTKSYASIPYERAPQVLDSVPTKGLLPGYSTPEKVWIA